MQLLLSLIAWANLPFTAAIGIVLTFAALQASGLLGLLAGDPDADHDADIDHDADFDADGDVDHEIDADLDHDADFDADGDVDHDVDADGDHDVDADGDHDVDADGDHDAEGAPHGAGGHGGGARAISPRGGGAGHAPGLLGALGVGRIPTSIIWQSFLMMFGLIGVVVNTIVLGTAGRLPAAALVLSFPAAVVGGLLCTAAIARTVVKVVKPGREAPGKRHLIGCSGTVVSGQVDEEFGEIRVRAPHGEQVNVYCAVRAGARPIAHHSEVVVVEYDRDRDRLIVAPLGLEEVEQAARRLPAGQRGSQ